MPLNDNTIWQYMTFRKCVIILADFIRLYLFNFFVFHSTMTGNSCTTFKSTEPCNKTENIEEL